MPSMIDLTDKKFGYWTAKRYLGKSMWECIGENNEIKNIHSYTLRNKHMGIVPKGKMPEGVLHKHFDNWYVDEYIGEGFWKCTCKCGNTGRVNTYDLKNGNSRGCVKCGYNRNVIDIKGQHFGEWEVLEYIGDMKWKCRCSCGTIRNMYGSYLRSHRSTNCGCKRNNHIIKDDITGREFGYLKVLGYTGKDLMWRCLCTACNTETEVFRDSLVSGKTKSCGCMKETMRKNTLLEKYGDTNTTRILNPREQWQIEVLESKENFAAFIEQYGDVKSASELSDILNVTPAYMARVINKFGFEDLIKHNIGVSGIELQVRDFIESFGYPVIFNDRKILNGKELDIYIPSKKLAIEFNGDYWHSNLFRENTYHQNKTIQCIKKGIHLIHIFEHEWNNKEYRQKIKNYLTSLLSDNIQNIYESNTIVREISTRECKDFLDKYHLQGYTSAKIKLGITYNNEIVGVMAIDNIKTREYELKRFCYKPNYKVDGGVEKIFNYFIYQYNPSSVIGYCDLAKSNGNIYFNLGFHTDLNCLTEPNYMWVSRHADKILASNESKKHRLIELGYGELGNTEDEIMQELKFFKVYDSGRMKFTWVNDKNKTRKVG